MSCCRMDYAEYVSEYCFSILTFETLSAASIKTQQCHKNNATRTKELIFK